MYVILEVQARRDKNGVMLINRIAHFIKQALSASLLLRALMRLFLSLCNSLFCVSSSFTILCDRLHENAAFAGNQMLYNAVPHGVRPLLLPGRFM